MAQDAVERFPTGGLSSFRRRLHGHVPGNRSRAGAYWLAADLHHARVASLDRAELRMVTDVGKLDSGAQDHVDEPLSFRSFVTGTVNEDCHRSKPLRLQIGTRR